LNTPRRTPSTVSFFSVVETLSNFRNERAVSVPPSQVPAWISVDPELSAFSPDCTYVVPFEFTAFTLGSTVTGNTRALLSSQDASSAILIAGLPSTTVSE